MGKMRELIGLPVLETKTGMQIGEVQEVVLRFEEAIMYGFLLEGKNYLLGQNRGVFLYDVFSVGRDAVTVHDSEVVKDFSSVLADRSIRKLEDIVDKQVYTETGQYLGIVVDIVFDNSNGEIQSYEISDSFVADFLYGRMIMPLPKAQIVNNEKLIVPEAMSSLLHTVHSKSGGVS